MTSKIQSRGCQVADSHTTLCSKMSCRSSRCVNRNWCVTNVIIHPLLVLKA